MAFKDTIQFCILNILGKKSPRQIENMSAPFAHSFSYRFFSLHTHMACLLSFVCHIIIIILCASSVFSLTIFL